MQKKLKLKKITGNRKNNRISIKICCQREDVNCQRQYRTKNARLNYLWYIIFKLVRLFEYNFYKKKKVMYCNVTGSKRLQFPLRSAFAMTISKSQDHSATICAVNLGNPFCSHGQFYVISSSVETLLTYLFTRQITNQKILYTMKHQNEQVSLSLESIRVYKI